MADPVDLLAMRQAIRDSAKVEVQLSGNNDCSPLLIVLAKARAEAADALAGLATVEAENSKEIRNLQNRVNRFASMIAWLSEVVADGFEADQRLELLSEQDREEIETLVAGDLVPEDIEGM